MSTPKNPKVYFDITIDSMEVGRITMELRPDIAPKTTENFRALCTGEKTDAQGKVLTYKGNRFHRVVPDFLCMAGDINSDSGESKNNGFGTGGTSIYGAKFSDENFDLKHTGAGTLSMSNQGPNTNGSQFIISFARLSWLDGKNVVFGKVVDGMDIVKAIDKIGLQSGKVSKEVVIRDCGELKV